MKDLCRRVLAKIKKRYSINPSFLFLCLLHNARMRTRSLILVGIIVLSCLTVKAEDGDTICSDHITASVLVMSPGEAIYSQFGHIALRIEVPEKRYDYCFSYEEVPGFAGLLEFFLGKTDAHLNAVPTSKFLETYRQEGRQVMQYALSLNPRQKQELWQQLKDDCVKDEFRKFNLLQNNCSSVSLRAVENVLGDEKIDFNGWPEQFQMINGDGVRYLSRFSPWLEFWNMTFLGTESDTYWEHEQQMSPELMPDVLKKASLVSSDGKRRPVLTEEKELLPLVNKFRPSPLTPGRVFGFLLIFTILITFAQYKWKLNVLPRALDVLLMTVVTIGGIILIHTSFVSGLFGVHWNWYLIPFNPLPFVIWLIWHKRKGLNKVYIFYTIVLVLFIIATPMSHQLDLPHQLITATLVVRCMFHSWIGANKLEY